MPKNSYHTPTTPNPGNFREVTADAYFTPDNQDGKTGDLRLGSITMSDLKHGNSESEAMFSFKGGLQRASIRTSEVKPEIDITLNEYIPQLVPVYLFGTPGPDQVQLAVTAQTATFASVNVGRAYRLGALSVSSVVVTVAAATKVQDVDYTLDADKGILVIIDGGGIADLASVSVSYSCAAVTRRTVVPYSRLTNTGMLRLFHEDSVAGIPREEAYFRCQLTPSDFGSADGKKFSDTKIKCAVLGQMPTYLRY